MSDDYAHNQDDESFVDATALIVDAGSDDDERRV